MVRLDAQLAAWRVMLRLRPRSDALGPAPRLLVEEQSRTPGCTTDSSAPASRTSPRTPALCSRSTALSTATCVCEAIASAHQAAS